MNMLTVHTPYAITAPTVADSVEAVCLVLPQKAAPVRHIFGPGIYIREVTMRRTDAWGELVIGHHHRAAHLNVMLSGRLLLRNDDGTWTEMRAPQTFVGPPGRKVAVVLEDVVWQNIYATDERDLDKLDELIFDKSEAFLAVDALRHEVDRLLRQADRDDFDAFLHEANLSSQFVRLMSERDNDMMPMPEAFASRVVVADSPIEGRGFFAVAAFAAGEVIAPARLGERRTPAGRFTNHSQSPNAVMQRLPSGDILLVAARPIQGCVGGNRGEEITVCYRAALAANLGGSQ